MGPSRTASFRLGAALALGALPLLALAQPGVAGDDVTAGQALYQARCAGCHSLDADRIGPRHRGVVGRVVASVSGYIYSPALRKLGGVWTPARLDRWLSDTQKMAPGSRMYLEMDDAAQRRRSVAYLQSVSPPGK